MVSYDHIELTDQEKEEALRLARKKKYFEMENRRYAERIRSAPVYPKIDRDGLKDLFFKRLPKGFVVGPDNREIIDLLILYFSGSAEFEMRGYSLMKGIMLLGPVGCGKTTIMRSFAINGYNPYTLRTCRSVADGYGEYGMELIKENSILIPCYPQQNYGHTSLGICYDDLGTEEIRKNYGNQMNVMASIIQSRYDNPDLISRTHFTGNLTADEMGDFYGTRARSRLREMCNVITFDENAKDWRI